MKRSLAVAVALCAVGFAAAHASGAPQAGKLLGGYIQVVAYSDSDVRICPDYAVALAAHAGPPSYCSTGLPATGVQTDQLPNQSSNPDERWGYLYLTGTYDGGTFSVTSQSSTAPTPSPGPFSVTPPCRRPHGGWRLVQPSQAQWHSVHAYRKAHPRDITSLAMFDKGDVATIASTAPKRTRTALERAWPKQLCVVRYRYSLAEVRRTKPTTPLDVLIETPQLAAVLSKQPPGLVLLDASLHPVPPS